MVKPLRDLLYEDQGQEGAAPDGQGVPSLRSLIGLDGSAPPQDRNLFARANDFAIDSGNDAAGLLKSGVDLVAPGSGASNAIAGFIKEGEGKQSDWKKAQRKKLAQDNQGAGELEKVGNYLSHIKDDPMEVAAQALGNVGPFKAAGLLFQTLGWGARASMALASSLSVGEVRGNILDKVQAMPDADLQKNNKEYADLRQQGISEAEAKKAVGTKIMDHLPELGMAAGFGAVSGKYGVEAMAAGKNVAKSRLGSAAITTLDEAAEGGVEQLATNLAVRKIDPNQKLGEDVLLNMAQEGLPGGLAGGVGHHGAHAPADAAGAPQGPSKAQELVSQAYAQVQGDDGVQQQQRDLRAKIAVSLSAMDDAERQKAIDALSAGNEALTQQLHADSKDAELLQAGREASLLDDNETGRLDINEAIRAHAGLIDDNAVAPPTSTLAAETIDQQSQQQVPTNSAGFVPEPAGDVAAQLKFVRDGRKKVAVLGAQEFQQADINGLESGEAVDPNTGESAFVVSADPDAIQAAVARTQEVGLKQAMGEALGYVNPGMTESPQEGAAVVQQVDPETGGVVHEQAVLPHEAGSIERIPGTALNLTNPQQALARRVEQQAAQAMPESLSSGPGAAANSGPSFHGGALPSRLELGSTQGEVTPHSQRLVDLLNQQGGEQHAAEAITEVRDAARELKQLARAIKYATGTHVVFVKTDLPFEGAALRHGNTLYMKADTASPLSTLGHELTHVLESEHPDIYAKLEDVILARMRAGRARTLRAALERASQREGSDAAIQALRQELVAEAIGELAQKQSFWTEAFQGIAEDRSATERFFNVVRDMIEKLRTALIREGYITGARDMRVAQQAAANAFREWGQRNQMEASERAADVRQQPKKPVAALGYSPLAGTPTVFPDGTVALNGEQELERRYKPQNVSKASTPVANVSKPEPKIDTPAKPAKPKKSVRADDDAAIEKALAAKRKAPEAKAPAPAPAPAAPAPAPTPEKTAHQKLLDEGERLEREDREKNHPQAPLLQRNMKLENAAGLERTFKLLQGKKFKTGRDLKVFLQDKVQLAAAEAGVNLTTQDAALAKHLTALGTRDAQFAMAKNANAVGWYDKTVRKALKTLALIHPELSTDPTARLAFTWALAVTSNGMRVDQNFQLAERAYRGWKETGAMPADNSFRIGTAGSKIVEGLQSFNEAITKWGPEATRKFMLTDFEVGQIKRLTGEGITGEHVDVVTRGAAVLGPKIGAGFFSNLYGHFDALTMDRWLIRTFGRWTATLIVNKAELRAEKQKQLAGVLAMLTPAQRAALEEVVGKVDQNDVEGTAQRIEKSSQKAVNRDVMNVVGELSAKQQEKLEAILGKPDKGVERKSLGDEVRKLGVSLAKYIDGQKEAPASPEERKFLRSVFGDVLKNLQKQHPNLTMADLQALLWYAERKVYESAKKEENEESYEDDEAPDYANAAAKLALANGVTQKEIDDATRNSAGPARRGVERTQESGAGLGDEGFVGREKQEFVVRNIVRQLRHSRLGSEGVSGPYTRKGATPDRGLRLLGATAVATFKADRKFANALAAAGALTPDFHELDTASAAVFHKAISDAKARIGPNAAAVYVYPAEDYAKMRTFLTSDGHAGFAIKGDDIVSVFSGGTAKGSSHAIMQLATQEGGRRLDAFDTILPRLYSIHGFRVVGRTAWNDEYAPDGWNKTAFAEFNKGQPDVVFMAYDRTRSDLYEPGEGPAPGEYDDAVAAQDKFLQDNGILFKRAYHGTPHDFKSFDTKHIGTGEGNQQFGWGLYFAGNIEVAEHYKNILPEKPGRLIEVDIDDYVMPRMLDWDKPMSKQTPELQRALTKFAARGDQDLQRAFAADMTGEQLYRMLTAEEGSDKGASMKLADMDIPGIQYMDSGSRSRFQASHNEAVTRNYVVFNGEDVAVQKVSYQRNALKIESVAEAEYVTRTGKLPYDLGNALERKEWAEAYRLAKSPVERKKLMRKLMDKAIDVVADSLIPVKRWIDGLPLAPELKQRLTGDLYRASTLRSMMEKQVAEDFSKPMFAAIEKAAKASKMTTDQVKTFAGWWMTARYAPKANALLISKDRAALVAAQATGDQAKITQAQDTLAQRLAAVNGAFGAARQIGVAGGLNNAEAAKLVANVEAKISQQLLQEIADPVYKMLAWKKAQDIKSGKVSRAMVNSWPNHRDYVPLTGDPRATREDDDVFHAGNQLNQDKDKAMNGRSDSIADNGIDAAMAAALKTINFSAVQDFKRTLMKAHTQATHAGQDIGLKLEPVTGVVRTGDDVVIYRDVFTNHLGHQEQRAYAFRFSDDRIIQALKKDTVESVPRVLHGISTLNRWYGRLVTQFVLTFAPVNLVRDVWERSELLRTKTLYGPGGARINVKAAARAAIADTINPELWQATFAKAFKTGKMTPIRGELEEMIRLGGSSVWGDYLARSAGDLEAQLRSSTKWTTKAGEKVNHYVEGYNNTFEMVPSLAIYRALKAQGMEAKDAAATTLDLMNFKKKGSAMPAIKALYVFAQPAAQSGYNLAQYLSTPTGRRRFIAQLAIGSLLYAMLRGLWGDDEDPELGNKLDNLSNFTVERSVPIPMGDKVVKIPVGFGPPQLAWVTAATLNRWWSGRYQGADAAGEMAKAWAKAVAPVAPSDMEVSQRPVDWFLQTFTPTVGKPIMQIGQDITGMGSKLTPSFTDPNKLRAVQANRTTPPEYSQMAQWIQHEFGVDLYPDHIKAILAGYAIGPLREALSYMVDNPARDQRGEPGRLPLVSSLVDTVNDRQTLNSIYYRVRGDLENANRLYHSDPDEHPQLEAQAEAYQVFSKREKELGSMRSALKKAGAGLDPEEVADRTREIEQESDSIRRELLRTYMTSRP